MLSFYAFLWARWTLTLASTVLVVSLGWHLYTETQNPIDLALVGLMQVLPLYLFFFAAGSAADRIPRRRVLIVSVCLELLAYAGIAWVMATERIDTVALYALVFVQGTARAFSSPALQAVLPNLVPKERLGSSVAMASTTWNLAMALGPAVAGYLILWLDRDIYPVIAASLLTVMVAYLLLPFMPAVDSSKRDWQSLIAGWQYVRNQPIILGSLSIDMLAVGLGSVMVLLPIFAVDVLDGGPETLGLLRAAPGLGAVLVGLAMTRIELPRPGPNLFAALWIFCASIAVFAVSEVLWLSLLALFVYGASDMISVNIRMTLVQLATPDSLRGRVSMVNTLFISTSNEAGDFRGGSAAALLGAAPAAMVGAGVAFAVVLWGRLKFPQLATLKSLKELD